MSPKVYNAYRDLVETAIRDNGKSFDGVLEIGAYYWSLLQMPELVDSNKIALNRSFTDRDRKALSAFEIIEGDSNSLPFESESIDLVMSCSSLEHDKYFWKTCDEMKRVLRKGAYSIVGVPIYMTLPTDTMNTTLTYKRHGISYNADFYRFSEQAMREVVFEGFTIIASTLVRRYPNPYLVVLGKKT